MDDDEIMLDGEQNEDAPVRDEQIQDRGAPAIINGGVLSHMKTNRMEVDKNMLKIITRRLKVRWVIFMALCGTMGIIWQCFE